MRRWMVAAFALATTLLPGKLAQAADCVRSLRIVNSVQMQSTTDRKVMLVPVRIGGSEKTLLLDTGGLVSQISRATTEAFQQVLGTASMRDAAQQYVPARVSASWISARG